MYSIRGGYRLGGLLYSLLQMAHWIAATPLGYPVISMLSRNNLCLVLVLKLMYPPTALHTVRDY